MRAITCKCVCDAQSSELVSHEMQRSWWSWDPPAKTSAHEGMSEALVPRKWGGTETTRTLSKSPLKEPQRVG